MEQQTDYRALYEAANDLLHVERQQVKELNSMLADAQATIAALQAQLKDMALRNKILRDRLDLPPERCAFHDEVVSLQARVEAHERAYQEGHPTPCTLGSYCPYCEIERRVAHLTQRTAECDALKLFNDTHMKTVMKLSHVVEQRTAELEAAKADRDELQSVFDLGHTRTVEADKLWQEAHGKPEVWPDLGDLVGWLIKRHDDVQAELERVRDQFADLRKMVAALPKVEGAVVVSNGYVKDSTRCHALFGADEDAALYAALLQHRQEMEG